MLKGGNMFNYPLNSETKSIFSKEELRGVFEKFAHTAAPDSSGLKEKYFQILSQSQL